MIIGRVAQLAAERNVSMTEIALAWLLTKAASPVAGATKLHHVEGAARAAELTLREEEINYLGGSLCSSPPGRSYGAEYCSPESRKDCLAGRGSSLGNARGREKEHLRGLTKEKEQRLMIDNIYWIYISK